MLLLHNGSSQIVMNSVSFVKNLRSCAACGTLDLLAILICWRLAAANGFIEQVTRLTQATLEDNSEDTVLRGVMAMVEHLSADKRRDLMTSLASM